MGVNDKKEMWRSSVAGMLGVIKYDPRGNEYCEVVRSGQVLAITTEERMLNQERAATEAKDFFKNGSLTPVKLLDDAEDLEDIAANPNLISEEDMKALFTSNWKIFDAKVDGISNVGTLKKMIAIANEGEATVRQVNKLGQRLADLSPSAPVESESIQVR